MNRSRANELLEQAALPIALVFGQDSLLVRAETAAEMQQRLPNCAIMTAIPHARHHIMVDQPIALISALRVAVQAITRLSEAA
jgi:pimeloyl-ACP methyl ester carboxylesterase